MRSVSTKAYIKKLLLANVGLALFGTPVAYIFISSLHETTLANSVGVVFIFVSIFLTMATGLDMFIKHSIHEVEDRVDNFN